MSKFILIAGTCVVESKETCDLVAREVSQLCKELDIKYIYKGSYLKNNRTSLNSFTGLDFGEAMSILGYIRDKYEVEVLTDIHNPEDPERVKPYVDWIQIPAFLCRQTDLLVAAGKSGLKINVKKGQFLTPDGMRFAVEKIKSTGNNNIMLTERGISFGYNDLIVDFRSIPIMAKNNLPVILDATHCLQKPNQEAGVSSGTPEFISLMSSLGIAAQADGLFLEVHPDPKNALSDKSTSLELSKLEEILVKCVKIKDAIS